jgi:hypothetical protein
VKLGMNHVVPANCSCLICRGINLCHCPGPAWTITTSSLEMYEIIT